MDQVPRGLQAAYANCHLALGLGAGVSLRSKMPNWHELVKRVAEQPEVRSTGAVASRLLEAGFDATIVGGYLRSLAGLDAGPFIEAVRRSLYQDFDAEFESRVGKSNHRRFATFVRETNPTLHAVGTFCGRKVGPDRFEPNLSVRALLNFNLDCLLQTYTRARFKKRVLRTIERASAPARSLRINTYHPHGYLLRDLEPKARDLSKEAGDRLVLTEHQYFDLVADANGFANYTMLYLLREYNFLFVGLSMTDPNLRRALHISRSERKRELKAEGVSQDSADIRSRRHWAIMMQHDRAMDQAIGQMLHELGVQPIWVSDWAKLPLLLQNLYESTSTPERPVRWSDVS